MYCWMLSPQHDVVMQPRHAYERMRHLEVGDKVKRPTLDNALSQFTAARTDAARIVRRVRAEVQQWKTTFEAHWTSPGAAAKLADALQELKDIASLASVTEIR